MKKMKFTIDSREADKKNRRTWAIKPVEKVHEGSKKYKREKKNTQQWMKDMRG